MFLGSPKRSVCLCTRKPSRKFNGEAIQSGLPVVDRHGPLLGKIAHGQVDDLVHGLIRGKDAMIARHLAQRHIDGFNGIGGIEHLANVFWEGK